MDFDPLVVGKLNEKKLVGPGSAASSLLSELKLRAIVENARQISKVDPPTLVAMKGKMVIYSHSKKETVFMHTTTLNGKEKKDIPLMWLASYFVT